MDNSLRAARLLTKRRQEAKDNAYLTPANNQGIPTAVPPPASPFINTPLLPSSNPMAFAHLANSLLPFFSGQDQQSIMTFLNTQDPNKFKTYLGRIPSMGAERVTNKTAKEYLSAERAKEALDKLENMRATAKLTEEQLGSGYKFLKQAIGLLQTLGRDPTKGEQSMTRAEFESMQSQLEALISQAKTDAKLAPYAELAAKFINPTLIGRLKPSFQVGGNTVYGDANRKLFT